MQKELLKDVVTLVVGKHAEDVIDYMDSKKYINEFLIAKKLDITINQLRNILYKLSDGGIVSSVRKKDKRKGWYTYFWKIEVFRALEFLKEVLEKRIEQLNSHIESRERKNFYICERCGIELSEENALLQDFICGECGEVFAKLLRELVKNIDKERKRLHIIDEEINIEKEKLEKKRSREIKKDLKLKKKKLLAKKASRKSAKKKKVKIVKKKSTSKKKKKVKIVKIKLAKKTKITKKIKKPKQVKKTKKKK